MTKLRPRLEALATATGRLSPRQVEMIGGMLAELARLNGRQNALAAACAILAAGQGASRWCLAKRLETALRRFRGTPRKRIEAGKIPNDWERIQYILTGPTPAPGEPEPEPTCSRRLWDEIKEVWD